MIESMLDGNRVKNIGSVADIGRMNGDVTCLVRSDTLSGSADFKPEEGKHNLFDYNTGSKFLTGIKPDGGTPVEVVLQLDTPSAVISYLMASGGDEPGRDPSAWTFSGSKDGSAWVVLDNRSGVTFSSRQEKKIFQFDNATAYTYYKISVTENRGASMTQFSELQLADKKQSAGEEDITDQVDLTTLSGSEDFKSEEAKSKLFDYDTVTKFLTNGKPSSDNPAVVSFEMKQPETVIAYIIGAGPDESGRNPKSWVFCGSLNGSSWVELDRQSGIVFAKEQETRQFTFHNETAYSFYKLEISENNGAPMTQFSELQLFAPAKETEPLSNSGTEESKANLYGEPEYSPMKTRKSRGPSSSYNALTSAGWTGWSALEVIGKHVGNNEAYCYNVIYDNLSIPVTRNTNLRYVFFPGLYNPDKYDFEYTSQYMAVDLKFTDGTCLSELSALDQNGNAVSPVSQGESGVLAYMQWNQIDSNIGEAAKGKTIEQILIGYHKPDNSSGEDIVFLGYFDDIVIEDSEPAEYEHLSDYVNILRGTNNTLMYSRGITTPLVTLPHGFNAYSPVTESNSTLPYYYQLAGSKTKLRHISIEHAASPWLGDWGTWQFMPNTDIEYDTVVKGEDIGADRRAADFTHEKEEAKAHYYGVTFEKGSAASGVKMEVTPTSHGMYARFTFPQDSENRNLIFDCERADGGLAFHGDGSFTAYSDHIYGYGSYNEGQVNGATRMYVYGVIDQRYDGAKVIHNKQGIIRFADNTNTVTMKLATSFISEEQAKKNLLLEMGENDTFDSVFTKAQKIWDDQLGIIRVEGASYDQLVTLYSCMYRMFSYPTLYAENAGTSKDEKWVYASPYKGNLTSPVVNAGKMYTINGFWDTYRSAWPAYALLTPDMAGKMLDGLLEHYKDSGWISRWIAPAAINCMLGTNIDAIFGDAMSKGIEFDYDSAFAASLKNSAVVSDKLNLGGRIETASAIFRGYTSTSVHEGFSWGMEDSINDYNIYKMAEALGKTDEAAYYKNRALSYVNYFNKDLGWYMARNADGSFRYSSIKDFDPSAWHGESNWDYCESNAWNMSFSAVQDVQGMVNLYGGKQEALERLDELFGADLRGKPVGMSEMREVRLGQYNHTNEPSLHLSYIYSYLGQPYKTQAIVRDVMSRCYSGSGIGQGYLGDEDNGAMSAWYVLNALGFYTPSAGNPEYVIGSPLFTKATVQLENGKTLVINAPDNSRDNVYIQNVKWNGAEHQKTYFTHEQLSGGGVIDFDMGAAPSDWGTGKDTQPASLTVEADQPAPLADIVSSRVKTGNILEVSSAMVVSKNTASIHALFDDTSTTAATLTGTNKEIIYFTPEAKAVSLYTLTSGDDKGKAPQEFKLYGSNNGRQWILLDEREGVTFQWKKYTRPFAVPEKNQKAYTYFKLSFAEKTDIQLSEIELIGRSATSKPKLVIDPDSITLKEGETAQLAAAVTDSESDVVVWSSSAEDIASVDQNGLVTAKKEGAATITAALSQENTVMDTCAVTVTKPDPIIDKTGLQKLYDRNKDKEKSNYTLDSWNIFQTALSSAKDILEDHSASQSTIDTALQTLQSAIDGLKENDPSRVNKTELQELYDSNHDKQSGNYTDESWTVFRMALTAAKDILDSASATQSDVDTALQTLRSAVDGLHEKAPVSSESPNISGTSPSKDAERTTSESIAQSPETGDTSQVIPMILLVVISACGVLITRRK